jgi:hypothetical protein
MIPVRAPSGAGKPRLLAIDFPTVNAEEFYPKTKYYCPIRAPKALFLQADQSSSSLLAELFRT